MVEKTVDVLIIGGGLVGAVLAHALSNTRFETILIEAKPLSNTPSTSFDARSLALAPASVEMLRMLNLWSLIEPVATPIRMIHVSEQGGFGVVRLENQDSSHPLGYVVEMQPLSHALQAALDPKAVLAPADVIEFDPHARIATVQTATGQLRIHARLVVAADGADSMIRQCCGLKARVKEYHQSAVVANIGLARPHQHIAYERFTKEGPLALLPMTGLRAALIWSCPTAQAESLQQCSEQVFLQRLQRQIGYRLGRLVKVGQRMVFPLRQVILDESVQDLIVWIGNAAHTLHPIAGQGFNLGLRDVAMLAQLILEQGICPEVLQQYQKARRPDQSMITTATNGLVELFGVRLPGAQGLRSLGLLAFDQCLPLKRLFSHYARGYAGVIPDLVCGIPLVEKI